MTRQHRTVRTLAFVAGCFFLALGLLFTASPAQAASRCGRAVVFTLPGVTWNDVVSVRPPTFLSLVRRGAIGSMSVHTDVSRPSYASAFTTLGAGARIPDFQIAPSELPSSLGVKLAPHVSVMSRAAIRDLSVHAT